MPVHWVAISVMPCFAIGFLTSYIIAGFHNHISWLIPCISDAGTIHPESCYFSQFMNIGSVLYLCFVCIRYLEIKCWNKEHQFNQVVVFCNRLGFWAGITCVLGISMSGNFQKTQVWALHYPGAIMAFLIGFVYIFIQTIITCTTQPCLCSEFVKRLRIYLTLASLVSGISCFAALRMACDRCCRGRVCKQNLVWRGGDPGYAWHAAGALGEWCLFYSLTINLMTYYDEFKELKFRSPIILKKNATTKELKMASKN